MSWGTWTDLSCLGVQKEGRAQRKKKSSYTSEHVQGIGRKFFDEKKGLLVTETKLGKNFREFWRKRREGRKRGCTGGDTEKKERGGEGQP